MAIYTGIIRGETDDATIKIGVTNRDDLRLALDLHDGINAKAQLQALAKQRYGTTIEEVEDQTSGEITWKIISDGTSNAIDAQRYEAFPTGLCRRLVKTKASLFTSDNQTWTITIPGAEDMPITEGEEENTDSEDAQSIWLNYREKGQANLKLIRADRMAVLMRVAALYMTWRSRRINYETVAPYNMYFLFNETLIDDGQERFADTKELEDCTALIVESVRPPNIDDIIDIDSKRRFTAWVGRTERYPDGRLLTYEESKWWQIPPPGDPRILFEDVNNPLSAWCNAHPDKDSIEYPISLILGTDAGEAEQLLPTEGIGLAETCVEVDLFTSRAMTATIDAAVGMQVWTTEKEITHPSPYPNVTVGRAWCKPGQNMEPKTIGVDNAQKAMDNLFSLCQFISENNDIPGYMVTPDQGRAPESGVALAIRTMPMMDDRQERATQAESAIQRMFEIEKRLINIYAEDGKRIPIDAELSWNPGQLELPESEVERIANIKALEDSGYIDHTEAVRRANHLDTRQEAERMIEEQGTTKPQSALDRLGGGVLPELEEDVEEEAEMPLV